MRRGAIFIGVDRTGNAPVLQDAAKGARRMAESWATGQELAFTALLTDEDDRTVTSMAIKDAVKQAINQGVEQLLVYFAGHGINRNRGEYWLLSGAPDDPQEAVNLSGSQDLARTCGIAHVVFISDACRTAADSILAGSVTGSEIFPNRDGRENPVDQFFACRLGMPSNEVKDAQEAAAGFKALYTEQLIPALSGDVEYILDWKDEDGKRNGYIHPQPLATYLEEAMLERLTRLGGRINQEPSARILSKDPAWISLISAPARAHTPTSGAPPSGGEHARIDFRVAVEHPPIFSGTRFRLAPKPKHATEVSNSLVRAALENPLALATAFDSAKQDATVPARKMMKAAAEAAVPFGPMHQESNCGFKIQGARFADWIGLGVRTERGDLGPDVVRVWNPPKPGTIVLLVFEDGCGTVLPAIPDFMCAMRMEGGELVDVAYEPSDNTSRWPTFQAEAQDLRALRGIASAASRSGVFRLEEANALNLARRMQMMKAIDPAFAVYAAYAYNDLQEGNRLKDMNDFMVRDLGGSLFDVAMLARALGKDDRHKSTMNSFAPLLAQGWAYINGRGIKLPPGLEDLPRTLKDSLWTLFNPEGVELLRSYIANGGTP